MMVGASVTLLRLLAGQEKRTSILGGDARATRWSSTGAAALATGAGVPAWPQLRLLLLAGGFAAAGQMLLMLATSIAPASRIGPTQYTQIAWATLIGAFVFGEHPDAMAILGLAIVAAAGPLMLVNEPAPAAGPAAGRGSTGYEPTASIGSTNSSTIAAVQVKRPPPSGSPEIGS